MVNIHGYGAIILTLGILLGIGWIYARVCRALFRSRGYSFSGPAGLAFVIIGLFWNLLGLEALLLLIVLAPAWWLERRRHLAFQSNKTGS